MQTVAQSFQGERGGRERSCRSRTQSRDAKLETLGLLDKASRHKIWNNYADCNTCILKTLYTCIECFHSRGQHLCEFIRTKGSVCIRKEYTSRRMPGRNWEFNRLELHSSHDLVFKMWQNNKTQDWSDFQSFLSLIVSFFFFLIFFQIFITKSHWVPPEYL